MHEERKPNRHKEGARVKCPKCGKWAKYNGYSITTKGHMYDHGGQQVGSLPALLSALCCDYE